MNACSTPDCASPKVPGQGSRYCTACRVLANERRLEAAGRRQRTWARANPEKKREQDHKQQARRRANPRPCRISGCTRPAGVPGTTRDLCSAHYHRIKRTGDPFGSLRVLQDPVCRVEGCDKPKWAQQLCPMHLYRVKKHGDVGPPERTIYPVDGVCSVTTCTRARSTGLYCNAHYIRSRRYGDPLAGGPYQHQYDGCSIDGCDGAFYARAMCQSHWMRAVGGPRRRTRNRGAVGECSGAQLNARIAYFGGRCWLCGADYEEIDHVKPLSRGGSNWPSNLRPVCKSCNCRKRSRWFGPARLAEVA